MSAHPVPTVVHYNGIPEYDLPLRGMEPGLSWGAGSEREVALWVTADADTQRTFKAVRGRETDTPVRDDRVVSEALTCACGRPAGADGLCGPCRMDYNGHVNGNGGRRL